MTDFSQAFVNFTITNAGREDARVEKRFHRDITIAELKVSRSVTPNVCLSSPLHFEAILII
jgi:hypothetical protein